MIPIVVLTGGGCGGKTTFMKKLGDEDLPSGRWILIPELADVLFSTGLRSNESRFEACLSDLQIRVENCLARIAKPGQVIICHRGSLDPLAFWLRKGWSELEFFAETATDWAQHYARYSGVIQLETAANGAVAAYESYVPLRPKESVEEAKKLDRLCRYVWHKHPNYFLIANDTGGWDAKIESAKSALQKVLESYAP